MNLPAIAAVAAVLTFTAAPAVAVTPAPYVAVLWEAGAGDVVWPEGGQTLLSTHEQDVYELVEWVDRAKLTPCTTYQLDVYVNDDTTRALIKGGKLYGPHNPAESFPKDRPSKYVVFQTVCPPPVPPQPADLSGVDTTVVTVCAEPLDGLLLTTTTDTPWTQSHVLVDGAWVPGEKVHGTPVVTTTESDVADCIPAAPEVPAPTSETVATDWSPLPTCDTPEVTQTRDVTTTSTDYTVLWNPETRVWDTAGASSTSTTPETRTATYDGPACSAVSPAWRTAAPERLAETGGTGLPIPLAGLSILTILTGAVLMRRAVRS